jgi:hypothetical protein
MPCRAGDVDSFMAELEHPLKAGVEQLRAAILAASDGISEQVKWNAPSFVYAGVDRVTFRLQPGNRLQLVLHRGVAVRDDAAEFRLEDDSGLLQWVAGDRAVITFGNLDDVATRQSAVVDVVNRWVAA